MNFSVKLRLIKPLEVRWEDVGPRLRELSWFAHRVLNRTMARLALAGEYPEDAPASWRSKGGEGKPYGYPMCARAIEDANAERLKVRRCSWCAGTGVEPESPVDKRGKPRKRRKSQSLRGAGEPCSLCDNGPKREYTIGQPIEVPSSIQLGWSRFAELRYREDRRDMLLGKKSLPSFRSPAPIVVSSSKDAKGLGVFRVRHDGRGYVLDIPLYPGGATGRVPFAVAPDGKAARAHMRALMSADAKIGDMKIKQQGTKWLAIVSYSMPDSPPAEQTGDDLTLKLGDRGVELWGSPLKKPKVLRGTETIRRQKAMFAARRKSRSQHQRDIGRGARGHGRTRALQHYHAVDDAEQRWLRSISQEIAAKAARACKARGARWVAVDESVHAVIPSSTIRDALEWALKKAGVANPEELSVGGNSDGEGRSV